LNYRDLKWMFSALFGLCALLLLSPVAAVAATAPSSESWHLGDWGVTCQHPKGKPRHCLMVQTGVSKKTKHPLYRITLAHPVANKPSRIEALLPLGVRLDTPVSFVVDKSKKPALILPYLTCMRFGCIAVGKLDTAAAHSFRVGSKGRLLVRNLQGKVVGLPFSLKGFAAATKKLDAESARK